MFTLKELTTPQTSAQFQTSFYSALTVVGVNTTDWKPGAVMRAFITISCTLLAAASQLVSSLANGIFLPLSTGDWLTLLALYGYNLTRIAATFASGTIALANAGGGLYVVAIGDLIFSNSTTGKTYRNTTAFTVLGGPSTINVPIQAIEAGAASSSAAGAINRLETALLGVTCSNAAAFVGTEQESDNDLRLRCSASLGALSPDGPADAYAYFARSAARPDGSAIGITRTRVAKDGYGNISVYLATPSAGIVGDEATVTNIFRAQAEPQGVTSQAYSASIVIVPVTYSVWLYDDIPLTVAEFTAAVSSALTAFFATQPIGGNVADSGGKIYSEVIKRVIQDVATNYVYHVTLSAPAGDVTLSAIQAPVAGAITEFSQIRTARSGF